MYSGRIHKAEIRVGKKAGLQTAWPFLVVVAITPELFVAKQDGGQRHRSRRVEASLENLTKQRIDLVTEQLAGDRSNQKSGGSSYRGMRPFGPPVGEKEKGPGV